AVAGARGEECGADPLVDEVPERAAARPVAAAQEQCDAVADGVVEAVGPPATATGPLGLAEHAVEDVLLVDVDVAPVQRGRQGGGETLEADLGVAVDPPGRGDVGADALRCGPE